MTKQVDQKIYLLKEIWKGEVERLIETKSKQKPKLREPEIQTILREKLDIFFETISLKVKEDWENSELQQGPPSMNIEDIEKKQVQEIERLTQKLKTNLTELETLQSQVLKEVEGSYEKRIQSLKEVNPIETKTFPQYKRKQPETPNILEETKKKAKSVAQFGVQLTNETLPQTMVEGKNLLQTLKQEQEQK